MTRQYKNSNINNKNMEIMMPEWNNNEYSEHLSSVKQSINEHSTQNQLKTTPLYAWHISTGANMANFGGYYMPLWYDTGVKKEHLGILKSAGVFDTSHMACITVKGNDAFKLLQSCFTRNIQSLRIGRCVYGAFLCCTS